MRRALRPQKPLSNKETIMTKKKITAIPEHGSVQLIPLDKLKKSPRNARKTPHPKADIEALAASIAANGMLQNPVVEPESGKDGNPTGNFLVTIGEGRRQAQLLRAKRKEIPKTEPIRCIIDTASNALEISLAENAIRSQMHPADQFDAFHELHVMHGMAIDDIAAHFGVTAAVVKQRLKLATISPALMAAYREDKLSLAQLMDFTLVDDHAKQESLFEEFGEEISRDEILEAIDATHVPATDRRVVFVGLETYEAAGGEVMRDLFGEENETFLLNPDLLNQLAQQRLAAQADHIRAEGWKWVTVLPRYEQAAFEGLRRIYADTPELSDEAQAQLEALEAEYDALDYDEEGSNTEGARIQSAMEALQGENAFDPEDIKRAGVFIYLAPSGEVRIDRAFIRPNDDERPKAEKPTRGPENGPAPISEKLVAELTAERTLALRDALGRASDLALAAVVHAFAAETFFPHRSGLSSLDITARSASLSAHAANIGETPMARQVQERHERWAKQLPEEPEQLWGFIRHMAQPERLSLLAHCAALTIDTVKRPKGSDDGRRQHGELLSEALGHDMAKVWSPTVENYLGRVSKERILEAVREGVGKEAADNIANLKKLDMAKAAEQRLQGKGWLPSVLRPQQAQLAAAAE